MLVLLWAAVLVVGFVPIGYLLFNAYYSGRRARHSSRVVVPADQITIVVPVHAQRPEAFRASIESIALQGCPFVVVGDGSLEPYRTMTEGRGGEFVYQPEQAGKKAALRAGMARVATPYVLFVDSDTVLPRDGAVRMASHFAPRVGGVGANLSVRDTGRAVASASEFVERAREVVLRAMSSRGSVAYLDGAGAMYRTELIREYVSSAEFQDLSVLGRPSHLGDDWLLTDFVLRAGYLTVKAYDVHVITAPAETFRAFARKNVRWARSNWIRLGSYFRRGFPRAAGRFYALEMTATYLIPLIALATLVTRVPLVAHSLERSASDAGSILLVLVRAIIPIPRLSWTGLTRLGSFILGTIATGAFVGATVRANPHPRLRLLAYGAVATLILFATSIYGLCTFWVEPKWGPRRGSSAPTASWHTADVGSSGGGGTLAR